jgi:LDH2 family malate/lactate/ureidoglycolate dehydrogenase
MAEQNVLVPVERVREFSTEILVRMGVPRDDARITTEILVAADLWGIQSHGIAHLALYHHRIKVGHQRATTESANRPRDANDRRRGWRQRDGAGRRLSNDESRD